MKFKATWLWNLVLVALLCSTSVLSEFDDELVGEIEDEDNDNPVEPGEPQLQVEKPVYKKPELKGNAFLAEPFHTESDFMKKWVKSDAKKDDADDAIAKYDGQWKMEETSDNPLDGDNALVLKSRAKHHAISAKLDKPYEFAGKPFVVQYEVKFQNGQECGGAYVKLLSEDAKFDLKKFTDKTGYTIMFGPDKCGNDNKLHFIFRHKNPVTGQFEEKHAKKPTATLDGFFTDKKVHLFTLVVKPDNTFEIYVDQDLINSGSLLEDMTPPVNPPAEIVDPEDKKPEDWDEREKIPDPEAVKPEDWDESQPEMIDDADATMPEGWLQDEAELKPDPESEMPEDWDEDMDGEWEPPMIQNPICEEAPGCGEWNPPQIKNPLYKGKWRPPMIDNPNYKGKWKPRKISNPDFFEDKQPYKMTSIGAIGLELWSMSDDIAFDNFIITDDKSVADEWAEDTWALKRKQELFKDRASSRSVVDAILDATNERPWLWAVFIVVIVLPIVLVIAYCCMPSSSKPEATSAKAKKTDEVTPDDEPAKEEDDEEEEEKEEKVEEKKDEGAGDAASAKATKATKSDLEGDEESNEADNEEEDGSKSSTRSSPRKRKTKARKD